MHFRRIWHMIDSLLKILQNFREFAGKGEQ